MRVEISSFKNRKTVRFRAKIVDETGKNRFIGTRTFGSRGDAQADADEVYPDVDAMRMDAAASVLHYSDLAESRARRLRWLPAWLAAALAVGFVAAIATQTIILNYGVGVLTF